MTKVDSVPSKLNQVQKTHFKFFLFHLTKVNSALVKAELSAEDLVKVFLSHLTEVDSVMVKAEIDFRRLIQGLLVLFNPLYAKRPSLPACAVKNERGGK